MKKRKKHSEDGWAVVMWYRSEHPYFAVIAEKNMVMPVVVMPRRQAYALRKSYGNPEKHKVVRVRITEI